MSQVLPWALWPWHRCPARREDRSRCDLRTGHAGDHVLERGIGGCPTWSTAWTGEAGGHFIVGVAE